MSSILLTMADLETAVPLNAALESAGFTTTMVSPLDDAPGALRREHPDLLILTGEVHEPSPGQLARLAREHEVYTLGLLESTDSERAERAARIGATELLTKPVRTEEAVTIARRLVERRRLQQHTGISGQSPAIHEVLVKLEQIGPVSSTVLVQGESGTGKELVAKALHDLSPRRGKAVIAGNCSALPQSLLESWLLGHEKGASIGARRRPRKPPPPAPPRPGGAASSRQPTGPSSSTRSAPSRPACRSSCSACWRAAPSSGSAAPSRSRWTCGSSPPPTVRSRRASPWASSARTSTIASTSSTSTSPRSGSGAKTSPSWSAASSPSSPGCTTGSSGASPPRRSIGWSGRRGRGTSGSSGT